MTGFEERAREQLVAEGIVGGHRFDELVDGRANALRAEHIRALEWVRRDCGASVPFPLRRVLDQRIEELKGSR